MKIILFSLLIISLLVLSGCNKNYSEFACKKFELEKNKTNSSAIVYYDGKYCNLIQTKGKETDKKSIIVNCRDILLKDSLSLYIVANKTLVNKLISESKVQTGLLLSCNFIEDSD